MADTDEVSGQQRHRGAAPSSGRSLLHRGFRSYQTPLLHDPLRYEHDLPVEQQEASQPVSLYQPELLAQPCLHSLGHPAVPPYRGLVAEPSQVACGGVAVGYCGIGKGVAEVGAEVEGALLSNAESVGYGLWDTPRKGAPPRPRTSCIDGGLA